MPNGDAAKYYREARFWRQERGRYLSWFTGEYNDFYGVPRPGPHVRDRFLLDAALAAWCEADADRYLKHLFVPACQFAGMKVLEIGCGPLGLARAFTGADVTGIDPLLSEYEEAGYPMDHHGITYVQARAESMAEVFRPDWFDAVIAVNAIDHVDDFEAVIAALAVVLKPSGRVRIEAHFHQPEPTEPIVLDEARVAAAFAGAGRRDVTKVADVPFTHFYPPGYRPEEDRLTVWSNFTTGREAHS
jgi:cyclopropane fatty-acyl-phospholipid synthase-like methyltransferase